jgi:hypothetical protein
MRDAEILFVREIIKRHQKVTGAPFRACFRARGTLATIAA